MKGYTLFADRLHSVEPILAYICLDDVTKDAAQKPSVGFSLLATLWALDAVLSQIGLRVGINAVSW